MFRIAALYLGLASTGAFATTLYSVGNSLTWDMQPEGLAAMAQGAGRDLSVGYHITAGQPLDYIWQHPTDITLTNQYGGLTTALPNYNWDKVTIEPFPSPTSTLATDTSVINNVINLTRSGNSTNTTFYIYETWPAQWYFPVGGFQEYWNLPAANDPSQASLQTRDYFSKLYNNVQAQNSGVSIFAIPVGEVFYRLDQEMQAGHIEGFTSVTDLFRDQIHLSYDIGRFVAATTTYDTIFGVDASGLERPLGQYINADGSSALNDSLRIQLQGIVWDVVSHSEHSGVIATPIPAAGYMFLSSLVVFGARIYKKRKSNIETCPFHTH